MVWLGMYDYTEFEMTIIRPWKERAEDTKAYYQVSCTENEYCLITEDLEAAKTMYLRAMFSDVERVILYDMIDMRVFDNGRWRKIGESATAQLRHTPISAPYT